MDKAEKAQILAVRHRIATDTAFAMEVFGVIRDRQKPDEIRTGRHQGHDGRGFRENETVYLNALYRQLFVEQGERLTAAQADEVRDRMTPYAAQFRASTLEPAQPRSRYRKIGIDQEPVIRRGNYRRLDKSAREQMMANIDRMAERHGM
jgi:hypothetical protein